MLSCWNGVVNALLTFSLSERLFASRNTPRFCSLACFVVGMVLSGVRMDQDEGIVLSLEFFALGRETRKVSLRPKKLSYSWTTNHISIDRNLSECLILLLKTASGQLRQI